MSNKIPAENHDITEPWWGLKRSISLCDAVNFIVEKYDLVRIDRRDFSTETQSPLVTSIDILLARKACGLMTRNGYRMVTDITTGKYRGVTQ